MVTIKIHLLNSRTTAATYNDVSIESPNNYRIIAGEKNATQFELVYDQNVWNGYTFSVEMVNSKGYSVEPPTITNNTFTLPNGMATAGYGYIGIKAEKESETVTFMPVKVKVWNYVEAWKGNVIDRSITFQEFVDLENRVEDLEQNGTGGGSVANAVTTDTEQTIAGKKTFTQPVEVVETTEYEYFTNITSSKLTPRGITTYDTEEGGEYTLSFPRWTDGTFATQEFVENYVAENGGGGSSADVGDIQICCIINASYNPSSYNINGFAAVGMGSVQSGTPIVGQYALYSNGIGLITAVTSTTFVMSFKQLQYLMLNGSQNSPIDKFFAPTTAGTSGYILKSNGSGAPSWVSPDTIGGGGSSGNQYTFTVTDTNNANTNFVFTLFGNLVYEQEFSDDKALLLGTIRNHIGYNKIVPASGVWESLSIVWGIKVVDYYTIKILTNAGEYEMPNSVQFTYYTQLLNKEFEISE